MSLRDCSRTKAEASNHLSSFVVSRIRQTSDSSCQIARFLGVHQSLVDQIRKGAIYRHVSTPPQRNLGGCKYPNWKTIRGAELKAWQKEHAKEQNHDL